MSCGCDCGSILARSAAAPVSPLQIVAADDIIAGWDAAVRVDVAGAVFTLPDVSGNGFNLSQAVALNQATAVIGGGPNGNDSILFDGVDDFMSNAALDLPAPGTTPLTYWGVLRQVTWVDTRRLWDASNGVLAMVQQLPANNIGQLNGALVNMTSFTVNLYSILEALFTDSPSDALRIEGTTNTGFSAGNNDPPSGWVLGAANTTGALAANIEVCELWLFRIPLTIQQRSQLRAYATNRYGAIP